MQQNLKDLARTCLDGAESGALAFPDIVGQLMGTGFDGYALDYRAGTATYYGPEGDSVTLGIASFPVAPHFDAGGIKAAIREAQQQVPGYTYQGFCRKVTVAGCAGYLVSFSGRRVLYFGRTGETHVEHFPQ
jgi:uncharacterized protein YbcV (DUF1398 family)